MNWLTNFVRPKIRTLVGRSEVPDNMWDKCKSCEQLLFHKELVKNLYVCPHCGCHMPIDVKDWANLLMDEGYRVLPSVPVREDPIKFRDSKKYTDRLKEARAKTSMSDALLSVAGTITGAPACVCIFNFRFIGGSMGSGVGSDFVNAAAVAVNEKRAFVVVTSSGGARMQEGIISLMQMPRTVAAINMVKKRRLPYIVIITDPTTGGVSASLAMLGDIHIAEPGATICFTGPRVIEETIKQKLPSGFQTAEYLRDHGMVDMVVERKQLKTSLSRLLSVISYD
ncbi:MAG: acetyl-CoA carboxylase, carboxyltransferase subunit beta [Holosporales bacterium]|nr:acetyl-CoA carboxylase, carboxyltransferase subunit beta [Holosporales bacterium]